MTVETIMIPDVETIEPDRPVADAAQIMLDNKYGCLPVVDDGRLVGIITEADFARCLAGMVPGVRVEFPKPPATRKAPVGVSRTRRIVPRNVA
jgi:predicted transcriptional regulator